MHDIAEQLEHIQSEPLVNKLDDFLGNPKFDPHGDPIPNAEGKFTLRSQTPLTKLPAAGSGVVIGVKIHDTPFLTHLNNLNIKLGSSLKVLESNSYDGSVSVLLDDTNQIMLSNKVASNILLKIS